MMTLFQEAIALNNRATHLIVSKRHSEAAIPILRKALCNSKAAIVQLEQPQEDQVLVGASQTCLLDECVTNAFLSENQKTDEEVDDDDFNTACEESFFIHRTPLPISSTTSTFDTASGDFQAALSAVLCWNLSLSHHISGLDTTCTKSARATLETALKLYSLTHKLIQQVHHSSSSSENSTTLLLLLMAVSNNMGQIHMKLGETQAANLCFQRVLNSLLIAKECEGGIWEDSHSILQRFFQNALHLVVLKDSFTATAA